MMQLDRQIVSSKEVLCLIPMKDVHEAKKRLRISFPSQKQAFISDIVSKLFLNTIDTIKNFLDFAVVSPSEDTLELALDKGASFIYQDLGIDLNDALLSSIIYTNLISKWKYILILTADLPYLSASSFLELQKSFFSDSITIISAPSKGSDNQGTSGLFLPIQFLVSNLIDLQFGTNSFTRFKSLFKSKNINFIEIHNRIGFDLDTLEDFIEFKNSSPEIFNTFNSKGEFNQLFTF
jgi:2-phospho-L-lactate guanylyltransferase (CobY/MobA/RfbA family)